MDKLSLDRLETMHPNLREKAISDYTAANNVLGSRVRLRIAYAIRSFLEQDALYSQGRETLAAINIKRAKAGMKPIGASEAKNKVTNARAGESYHNYGLAFDIVLLYDNNGDGVFEEASWDLKKDGDGDKIADWAEVIKVLTDLGWTNGFWTNGKHWDKPHFQITFGNSVKQLRSLYDQKKFISGTTFVKIT